jgi:hypothetical protein
MRRGGVHGLDAMIFTSFRYHLCGACETHPRDCSLLLRGGGDFLLLARIQIGINVCSKSRRGNADG